MQRETFLCGTTAAVLWILGAGCGSQAASPEASLEAPLAECDAMVAAMERCVGNTASAGSVEALGRSVHPRTVATQAQRSALQKRCIQGHRQLERACP